jgi:hypothetical protein
MYKCEFETSHLYDWAVSRCAIGQIGILPKRMVCVPVVIVVVVS